MTQPDLVVLVPALERPHRVAPLLDTLAASTSIPYRALFICDPSDFAQQRACHDAGVDVMLLRPIHPSGPYAAKINAGVRASTEPLIFLGADDLAFQPGWLEAALDKIALGAQVVGVNDLIARPRRPEHATHFLMTRDYAELPTIDGQPGPLYEGYSHWCVDDELIATAQLRDVYAYALSSRVEHLHPLAGKAPMDDTYERGARHARLDRRRWHARRPLFTHPLET